MRIGAKEKELSGYEPATTNNRMELTAVIEALRARGATNVVQLHTRDPKVADTEEFAAPLRTARVSRN